MAGQPVKLGGSLSGNPLTPEAPASLSHNLNSLKGGYINRQPIIGAIKGHTRSFDYTSCGLAFRVQGRSALDLGLCWQATVIDLPILPQARITITTTKDPDTQLLDRWTRSH